MRKRIIAAAIVIGGFLIPTATASAADDSYWTWYEKTQGTSRVDTVRIKTACINAEDSAAHLHLINYGGGIAVYGCSHKGY